MHEILWHKVGRGAQITGMESQREFPGKGLSVRFNSGIILQQEQAPFCALVRNKVKWSCKVTSPHLQLPLRVSVGYYLRLLMERQEEE